MSLISPSLQARYASLLDQATAVIHRHQPLSVKDELSVLADTVRDDDRRDTYGRGGMLEAFEAELCTLLSKPDCLFLPTGTLAQCVAVKCASLRTGRQGVALHPTSHLLLHEHMAVEHLWGLKSVETGKPEQVLKARDLDALDPASLCALIVETPMREIGGAMPSWDDLLAIRQWCDTHGVHLHLDGARLWQTARGYERTLAQIAGVFDSIYISFYKDLGGIFGAALLADKALIDEARVWARRAGGNPITQYAEVLAARRGLAHYLPMMPEFVHYTRVLCDAIRPLPLTLIPEQPEAAMFHVRLPMDANRLVTRLNDYAQQTGVMVLPLPRSGSDTHCVCEVSVGDNAVRHAPDFWAKHLHACLHQSL
ncbi:threonine aldolase family protein [Alteromonas sp. CYL-A6]|uniref:threonine aldolase family protein n=1 Tax=Alteromonas nitratireducens TaxID=3390813 RepID=UPI0034BDF2BA